MTKARRREGTKAISETPPNKGEIIVKMPGKSKIYHIFAVFN